METLAAIIIVLAFILIGALVCAFIMQGRAASKNDQANADRWHKFSADTLKAALAINSMELDARRIDAEVDKSVAESQSPRRQFPSPGKQALSPEAASTMGLPHEYMNGDPSIIVAKVDSTGNPNY